MVTDTLVLIIFTLQISMVLYWLYYHYLPFMCEKYPDVEKGFEKIKAETESLKELETRTITLEGCYSISTWIYESDKCTPAIYPVKSLYEKIESINLIPVERILTRSSRSTPGTTTVKVLRAVEEKTIDDIVTNVRHIQKHMRDDSYEHVSMCPVEVEDLKKAFDRALLSNYTICKGFTGIKIQIR